MKIKNFLIFAALLLIFVLPAVSWAQFSSPEDPDFVDPTEPLPSRPGPGNNNFPTFQPTVFQNSSAAPTCYEVEDLGDVLCRIASLLNTLIPILLLLGVVYFVFGVVQYVIGNDEDAKKKGRDRIIFGIIGLTIIVTLWGLVAVVIKTFGIDQSAPTVDLLNFRVDQSSQPGDSAIFCSLGNAPKLQNLFGYATCIITKSIVPLIFAVALVAFVWGVIQYVIFSDSDEKRAQGRQFMLWGIIALTVMISVWGLVKILASTFNVDNVIPQVKSQSSGR